MTTSNVVLISNSPNVTTGLIAKILFESPAFRLESMAACLEACGSNLLQHSDGTVTDLQVVEIHKGPDPFWGFELATIEKGIPHTRSFAVVQIDKCGDPLPFFRKWVDEFCTPEAKSMVFCLLCSVG